MNKKRLLIAEDHAILREGLRSLLAKVPDLEIVAEAPDGKEAIQYANQLKPDMVLMDLSMPHTNGTEAIRSIKLRHPGTKIIVLTAHKTEEYVRAALEAGADGYVLKDDSHSDLQTAIDSVARDRVYLSPGIAHSIVQGYLNHSSPTHAVPPSWDRLTARERGVITLIAEGFKNREIAEYLSLSPKTVEKHRSNLMRKLDLHNVSAVTAYAMEHGLVTR